MRPSFLLPAACWIAASHWGSATGAAPAPASLQESPTGEAAAPAWKLGTIEVRTAAVYPAAEAEGGLLPRVVNATHWTTHEKVIRREIWKSPGDPITEDFARELERNLRRTGLFAEATAELVPTAEEGVHNLVVRTRDRLSISGGASGSFVGNVASGGFSLSESNLFGSGDRLRFGFFENDEDEFRGSLSYRDRYLFDSWTSGNVEVGRTDQGDFAGARIIRPFRYLEDDFAWQVNARTAEAERDYFFKGDTVTEVPFDETGLGASATWRSGTAERFWTRGLVARFSDTVYGRARGADIGTLPGDTEATFVGASFGFADISGFDQVTGLDTLQFIQDVQLGFSMDAEAGATLRSEEGEASETQPTGGMNLRSTHRIGETRYVSLGASGAARLESGEAAGWSSRLDLRAFDLTLAPHTFAFSARLVNAEENQDLPVQLTLGEDNGLRGYPRREFAGDRILRLNLEDRIDLGISTRSFDFGAVVFADLGWASERGEGFGGPLRSVGAGLRIGSNALLGGDVLRIDLSFPLDELDGISYDPLLSITLGQVFGLR